MEQQYTLNSGRFVFNFLFAESNIWIMLIMSIKGLPRSGGEKNYLEYIYRRPKFMVTCIFTVYTLIMVSRLSKFGFHCSVHPSLAGKLDAK